VAEKMSTADWVLFAGCDFPKKGARVLFWNGMVLAVEEKVIGIGWEVR
jgi:hypothetical protein